MRRDVLATLVGLSITLLAPSSLAQSTVELGNSISISEGDMGIEGISVSENQDFLFQLFVVDPNVPPPAALAWITRHTKTHRSLPPTDITRLPSALKHTFVTWALWPLWTMHGAHQPIDGELKTFTLPKSSAVTIMPNPGGPSIPETPTPRASQALMSVRSPLVGQMP